MVHFIYQSLQYLYLNWSTIHWRIIYPLSHKSHRTLFLWLLQIYFTTYLKHVQGMFLITFMLTFFNAFPLFRKIFSWKSLFVAAFFHCYYLGNKLGQIFAQTKRSLKVELRFLKRTGFFFLFFTHTIRMHVALARRWQWMSIDKKVMETQVTYNENTFIGFPELWWGGYIAVCFLFVYTLRLLWKLAKI